MILRIYRAVVYEGQQGAFRQFFEEIAIPTLNAHEGLEELIVGWPHENAPREFSMVQVWRDLNALKAFTGEDWESAVVHPDEAHLLEETFVTHYNVEGP